MASGGNEAPHAPPQTDAPPLNFAANGHYFYPAHYLPHFPQIEYPKPQFLPAPPVNPPPYGYRIPVPPQFLPAPPVNPYAAPYGYRIPVPPTYQDPNLVYGGIGIGANLSTSQTAAADVSVAGVEKRTNGSEQALKKLKSMQSWFCEVCKVDCNRKSILDQHKLGKKHRKNLEKMVAANRTSILPASADSGSQLIGPLSYWGGKEDLGEDPVKGKIKEDLGAKTTKLLKEGAAADSVRVCAICNVVCNSETVFMDHLTGQKHMKEVKKHNNA